MAAGAAQPSVTTIILNYNAVAETMFKCLDALARQDYPHHRVLLVDNASPHDILPEVARRYPDIELLRLDKNYGFAGGVNRGIARAGGDFVFLLNFDAYPEPDSVSRLVEAAARHPEAVGVAPKMISATHPGIIDSVGIAMGYEAAAFNLGIGQPDIGQYDLSEPVFGACFGAALLRRSAFAPDEVGPLDEDYFMYYEDVDWCYRANLLGHIFVTAPDAVVHHEHSASVKDLNYDFKYKLIELNLFRTAVKDYQRRQAVKIPLKRLRTHLINGLSPRSGKVAVSWAIILAFLADLPRTLPKRWEVQRRRRVADTEIRQRSFGEQPYYDPTIYEPLYSLKTLIAAYRRLNAQRGDDASLRIWYGLEALHKTKFRYEDARLHERLDELLQGQPPHVLDFAARITGDV